MQSFLPAVSSCFLISLEASSIEERGKHPSVSKYLT